MSPSNFFIAIHGYNPIYVISQIRKNPVLWYIISLSWGPEFLTTSRLMICIEPISLPLLLLLIFSGNYFEMVLLYFIGLVGIGLIALLVLGYSSPTINQVEIRRTFTVNAHALREFLLDVERVKSLRTDIKSVEIIREHNGMAIEWIVHTTRGGFRIYRIESRSEFQFSKILVSSTFGVTGRWDYFIERHHDGVTLTIDENCMIPSFLYRTWLLIRGKNLHLRYEINGIEKFIGKQSKTTIKFDNQELQKPKNVMM